MARRIDCGRYFKQLGDMVQQRWRALDRDTGRFAEVAAAALADLPPTRIAPADLLRFGRRARDLPPQRALGDETVDLGLTLWESQQFSIKAQFRSEATPIHQHAFVGASYLLSGSTLHTRYRFIEQERVSSRLLLGALPCQAAEVVGPGHIRRIEAGDNLIHNLSPVAGSTVTIVIASADLDGATAYVYDLPGVARDLGDPEPRTTVLTKILGLLGRYDLVARDRAWQESVVHPEFEKSFAALEDAGGAGIDANFMATLVERARGRHGERVDRVLPMLAENARGFGDRQGGLS
jgi:hypothetical protein